MDLTDLAPAPTDADSSISSPIYYDIIDGMCDQSMISSEDTAIQCSSLKSCHIRYGGTECPVDETCGYYVD